MHLSFTDQRALILTEARHGIRNTRDITWAGPRVWAAIESFDSAPFHIDQLIVIDSTLTVARIKATIHYINGSGNAVFIESRRYAKQMRWLVHYGDKQAMQVRAMMHRHKSRRIHTTGPLNAEIEEL